MKGAGCGVGLGRVEGDGATCGRYGTHASEAQQYAQDVCERASPRWRERLSPLTARSSPFSGAMSASTYCRPSAPSASSARA